MDYWRREQVGVASGIGAVALLVVAGGLVTSYPSSGADAQLIRTFILDNRTMLLAQSFVMAFGVVAALWFFGSLRSTLRRAEGGTGRVSGIAFAGGASALLGMLAGCGLTITLANRVAETVDPGVTLALWQLSNVAFALAGFAFALGIGAASLVALRTGIVPRWMALAGVVPVMLSMIGPISIFYESGTMGLGDVVPALVPFVGALGWILAASIVLTTKLKAPVETAVARRRISDISEEPPQAIQL
ncbi:MAG: hypothetical protein WDA27_07690 [Actinomycetota bacterium]